MSIFKRVRVPWIPVVSAVAGVGLAHQFWLAPFTARQVEMKRQISDFDSRTNVAREAVKQVQDLEQESAGARVAFERWQRELPKGSAMLWLPDRMKSHFSRFGLGLPVSRLNTTLPEPGMPRVKRSFWAVEVGMQNPAKDTTAMLLAVAELDQQDALVRVLDFSIRADARKPGRKVGTLNLTVLASQ